MKYILRYFEGVVPGVQSQEPPSSVFFPREEQTKIVGEKNGVRILHKFCGSTACLHLPDRHHSWSQTEPQSVREEHTRRTAKEQPRIPGAPVTPCGPPSGDCFFPTTKTAGTPPKCGLSSPCSKMLHLWFERTFMSRPMRMWASSEG